MGKASQTRWGKQAPVASAACQGAGAQEGQPFPEGATMATSSQACQQHQPLCMLQERICTLIMRKCALWGGGERSSPGVLWLRPLKKPPHPNGLESELRNGAGRPDPEPHRKP